MTGGPQCYRNMGEDPSGRGARVYLRPLSEYVLEGRDMTGIAPDIDIAEWSEGMPVDAQCSRSSAGHYDWKHPGGRVGPQRLQQCQRGHDIGAIDGFQGIDRKV